PHSRGIDADDFRQPRDEIAALHVDLLLGVKQYRGADPHLDPLRGRLTDEQTVGLAHVLHDRLIQLVSAGANGGIADDTGEGDDGDVRGAAADVDDYVARRRLHRQPYSDRRR